MSFKFEPKIHQHIINKSIYQKIFKTQKMLSNVSQCLKAHCALD